MPSKKEPQNDSFIVVKGAKEHNLKNLNVSIPRDSLTVITGLSGSGKSSLAFDTIFAEGQRRYVESLSTYARQFLEVLDKPEVESIDGLSPTISIQQKTSSHNPRSTVGTVTEVYDYMRLLYARVSMPYCYNCNKPIASQTAQQMAEQVLSYPEGSKINLLSPMVRGRKGEYQKELNAIRQKGFSKVRIDGEVMDLSQPITLDKQKKHDIDVYVDRLVLRTSPGSSSSAFSKASLRARILESIETALKLSEGLVKIVVEGNSQSKSIEPELLLSEKFACGDCGISYPQPEPRTFSFNSPMGACKTCEGIGFFSEELDKTPEDSEESSSLTVYTACAECKGARLKAESLFFKIEKKNIAELSSLSILRLRDFFKKIDLNKRQLLIADRILKEIRDRLDFLVHVGVEYLSLDRSAQTLSGGESQRIRLATQIGSSLTGVTYILDEPSIGLHQRDNDKLLETLIKLRDNGNTLLVVEHDKDTMEKADFILDLGPGAGMHGGHIVAQGSLSDILKNKDSLTSKYLTGDQKIEVPPKRRTFDKKIQINGVTHHNLEDVNAFIPLGVFTCVTGVSGSGKSTLVLDTLYPYLMHQLFDSKKPPVQLSSITGAELIDKVIDIDQSPIGRTPRSNPATYTGTFSFIRELFAQLPESRMRGFKSGRFSFNVKGGRCEKCQGAGLAKVEMHFLSDIYVACDACDRKRFNDETLSIKYRGKSISDVLDMTIEEAATFFENVPSLFQKLKTLSEVGLSYITLGQSATTLSGGEAQRMKLAKELSRRATGKTLYILDEPSTGLHFDDIRKLLALLHRLVEQGNTVVVIEHNLEIIKTADYIIDMGPEGGELGGKLIASGTPEEVANVKGSYTGKYLKPYLR